MIRKRHGALKRRRRRRLLLRRDPHCWYCGAPLRLDDSTLDHFIPRARGGTNDPTNLRLACDGCNCTKADAPAEAFACLPRRGAGLVRVSHEGEFPMIAKTTTRTPATFDYATLNGHGELAREHAAAIHTLLRRTARDAVEIGRRLCEVREALGPVPFSAWLKGEFHWSQTMASHYMRAFRQFADLDCLDNFQPSALFELTRDRTPAAAVEEAVSQARSGQQVTYSAARRIAVKHSGGAAGQPAVKPKSLYNLRSSIRQVADTPDEALAGVPAAELDDLANALLQLALRIRNAIAAPPPSGRAKRLTAAAAAE